MRKRGYLVIDEYKDHRTIKNLKFFPLSINGEEYFFKCLKHDQNAYYELIAKAIADDFGISCASYDLATYHDSIGVITKNFIKEGDTFFTGFDLMKKVLPESETKLNTIRYNNLAFYKKHVSEEVFDDIERMLMFDILTANVDRNEDNFGFIQNQNGISLAPIYDNEKILSRSSLIQGFYRLSVDEDDDLNTFYQDPLSYRNIIRKYILKYKKADLLAKKLEIISNNNIENIIDRVEEQTEYDMPNYIKSDVKRLFNDNKLKIERNL